MRSLLQKIRQRVRRVPGRSSSVPRRQLRGQAIPRDPSVVDTELYLFAKKKYVGKILKHGRGTDRSRSLAFETEMHARRRTYYDLETYDESLYINDLEYEMSVYINGEYRRVLKNKLLSYQVLANFARVPKAYLLQIQGNIEDEDPALAQLVSASTLTPLFVKPLAASGGKGAEAIEVGDGKVVREGGEVPWEGYLGELRTRRDTIVQERLRQSEFAAGLYPGSINTLRVLTMRDPTSRTPFVCRAVQRVGTAKSEPVDNCASGGISFDVDLDTGTIGFGYPKKSRTRIERHPDTGVEITGQVLPDMALCISEVVRWHRLMPYLDYAAWDLCHAEDGGLIVVEGNSTSDVGVFQVHRPLLTDERAVAFYRHHRII